MTWCAGGVVVPEELQGEGGDETLASLLAHLTNGLFDVRKEVQDVTIGVYFD